MLAFVVVQNLWYYMSINAETASINFLINLHTTRKIFILNLNTHHTTPCPPPPALLLLLILPLLPYSRPASMEWMAFQVIPLHHLWDSPHIIKVLSRTNSSVLSLLIFIHYFLFHSLFHTCELVISRSNAVLINDPFIYIHSLFLF